MPTDLRQLPLWARVAFACRCARAVRAKFRPGGGPDVFDEALDLAERAAAAGTFGTRLMAAAEAARRHREGLSPEARDGAWPTAATAPAMAILNCFDVSLSAAAADHARDAAIAAGVSMGE